MQRRTWVTIIVFLVAVFLFTRIDFLINYSLYGYGLQFSQSWYSEYALLYGLLYQFVIVVLLFYSGNLFFVLMAETFVLSSAQDLVYFGVWQGAFPLGRWVWLWYAPTTPEQIVINVGSLLVAGLLLYFFKSNIQMIQNKLNSYFLSRPKQNV